MLSTHYILGVVLVSDDKQQTKSTKPLLLRASEKRILWWNSSLGTIFDSGVPEREDFGVP